MVMRFPVQILNSIKDTQSQIEMHLWESQLERLLASGEQMCCSLVFLSSQPFSATPKPESSWLLRSIDGILVTQCPSSPLSQGQPLGFAEEVSTNPATVEPY